MKAKYQPTRKIIKELKKECLDKDCRGYTCDRCPVVKKSIEKLGIDVLR